MAERAAAAALAALLLAILVLPAPFALWLLLFGAPLLLAVNAAVQKPHAGGWRPLIGPAVLFGLALLAAGLAASPVAPGGVNPFWAPVGAGAASIDREAQSMGMLKLLALAAAFEAARWAGGRRETLRAAFFALILAACGLALATLVVVGASAFGVRLLFSSSGLPALALGAVLLVAAEPLIRRLSSGRSRSDPAAGDRREAIASVGALLSAAALVLTGSILATIVAVAMLVALGAWTVLASGGRAGAPRRVMLWLVPAILVLAVAVGLMTAARLGEKAAVIDMGARSWTAFWASPWLGYGLGATDAVAKLFMTRADFTGVPAAAPAAVLTWLEEGGVLTAAPLVLCIGWLTVGLVRAAVRGGRSGGALRVAAVSSVLIAVMSLFSDAPATPGAALLWALLLGLGTGAADSR